jgi:hypothetical protein
MVTVHSLVMLCCISWFFILCNAVLLFLILSLSFRRVANVVNFLLPLKMEPIVSSETSASNTQTPGSYPKESLLQCYYCM